MHNIITFSIVFKNKNRGVHFVIIKIVMQRIVRRLIGTKNGAKIIANFYDVIWIVRWTEKRKTRHSEDHRILYHTARETLNNREGQPDSTPVVFFIYEYKMTSVSICPSMTVKFSLFRACDMWKNVLTIQN